MPFSKKMIPFLQKNKEKNDREWYNGHKDLFKKYVQEPFYALVDELTPCLNGIDSEIVTIPRYCLCHVYRDTRFTKDKSTLYRDNMWLTFKRSSKKWTESPCFYFEVLPDSFRYGMGYYSATSKTMQLYRKYISLYPESFGEALRPIQDLYLDTEYYKKKFRESYPEEFTSWFMAKNIHVTVSRTDMESLYSANLAKEISDVFLQAAPLYKLLLNLRNMPELLDSPLIVPENKVEFEW